MAGAASKSGPAGVDRKLREPRARERDGGEVVRVARVGEDDRVAVVGGAERDLDERRLRARDEGDLALRVNLDAVNRAVAVRDGLLQRRRPEKGA